VNGSPGTSLETQEEEKVITEDDDLHRQSLPPFNPQDEAQIPTFGGAQSFAAQIPRSRPSVLILIVHSVFLKCFSPLHDRSPTNNEYNKLRKVHNVGRIIQL
jgi:hypothetical protein